ncbi:hypothetical protein EVJ58_g902 [Rhodofomes roseus]|uniref:Uncharacterized protein n=1 Tax=Rhodofomes roseus TaxID=34475 RepID=A0A4Y9Z1V9_9APHY|nr:hypothetical protein EVJ58_g902 [Rhodofomes roseus]
MSEDDRAAKAARARALLKKKQQQKAAGGGSIASPTVASPVLPPSRAFSPAPSEITLVNPEDQRAGRNVGDLFSGGQLGDGGGDISWLSGLNRVDAHLPLATASTSPPAVSSPAPVVSHGAATPEATSTVASGQGELHAKIAELNTIVSALEAEKHGLKDVVERLKETETSESVKYKSDKDKLLSSLEKLQRVEANAQQTERSLHEERQTNVQLQDRIQQLEAGSSAVLAKLNERDAAIASLSAQKGEFESTIHRLSELEPKLQAVNKALEAEKARTDSLNGRIHDLETTLQEHYSRIAEQQQTISLLVSEKTSLTSSLEQLEDADTKLRETESALQAERTRAQKLQETVAKLQDENDEFSSKVTELSASERTLADKSREQERELQLLHGTLNDLRIQAEKADRRVRELEEQIESDDRAERLEATLQNTQDRADELEFQLSKLQQASTTFAHGTLKAERDELDSQVRQRSQTEEDWRNRHGEVEKQHAATKEQLSSVSTERDSLLQEKSNLQSKVQKKESTVADLERKLADLAAQLSNGARQLQQVQAELKSANKRAEEAERLQGELQTEGVGLMRSLDEMRPKIVELTDAKLNLGEEVEGLKSALRSRDATIAQLEANLDELLNEKDMATQERQEVALALEKERSSSNANSSELQKESDSLQAELDAARAVIRNLESEHNNYHQMTERHLGELDQLKSALQEHMEQVSGLQSELDERQDAQQEAQEFLEHAQDEMEALRAELSAKDQELEQLRVAASTPISAQPNALDEEMLSAIKQQHALELSAVQSHMRTLETSVFEAEAHAHALQKHVTALEDQLAHLRPSSRASQRSPMPPRTSSRPVDFSDDLRRASFNAHKPSHLAPTPTSATFEGLSPEAQHKRRVSLSMLKARIDSEVAATAKLSSPTIKTAGLPTVVESAAPQSTAAVQHHAAPRKPQFMDDSHIFWCHCCQGDLVIL